MRIGSLFTGVAGLDMAVQGVFGGTHAWFSEIDKAASRVLAYRFPGVRNLGDITQIGWESVEPVDVLCGGFPCQDVSAAGKRAGIKQGTRSGLWSVFAEAIDALRPRWVVIENVRGLLSATAERAVESGEDAVGNGAGRPVLRAAGAVLGDLADLGYDAQWATVAAADIGAPHRRERVFILATDAGGNGRGRRQECDIKSAAELPTSQRNDADRCVLADGRDQRCTNAADAPGDGWDEGRPEPAGRGFDVAVRGDGHGVALLPTPTTQDGANNGGPSQFQRNTLPLNAEVTLLPTPQAHDSQGPKTPAQVAAMRAKGAGVRNLNETAVHELLSTPQSRDYKGRPSDGFNNANLCRDVALLCTPSASDGAGGKTSRSGGRINEPLLGGQAREMAAAWGKYEPAIRRWEQVTGQPAPPPTEPNKNGNPRLSAAFSEWLMGWPPGWVTDPAIGISRNDQLRCVGNGVCPQQAAHALTYLTAVAAN